MNSWVVIDTNVAVVANGKHELAGPTCVLDCIGALKKARTQIIVIDDDFHILKEYRRNLSPSGQPGAGDAFFKWLWENQSNLRRCLKVNIVPIPGGKENFSEFPNDPDLDGFDPSDRKFVSVALASDRQPPILNASDTDWWQYRDALGRNGIQIDFICPELMRK